MSLILLKYEFDSPINTVHVITHNMNTICPNVIAINKITNKQIYGDVEILNSNQIQITFFVPRDIKGYIS